MKKLEFSTSLIDTYFDLLRNLSDDAKQHLIKRLKKSLKKGKNNSNPEMELFGSWQSDHSADQIIDELRKDRNTNRQIEDL